MNYKGPSPTTDELKDIANCSSPGKPAFEYLKYLSGEGGKASTALEVLSSEIPSQMFPWLNLAAHLAARLQSECSESIYRGIIDIGMAVWSKASFTEQRGIAGVLATFGINMLRPQNKPVDELLLTTLLKNKRIADFLFCCSVQSRDIESVVRIMGIASDHEENWRASFSDIADEMNMESGARWNVITTAQAVRAGLWPSVAYLPPSDVSEAFAEITKTREAFHEGYDVGHRLYGGYLLAAGVEKCVANAGRSVARWKIIDKIFVDDDLKPFLHKSPLAFKKEKLELDLGI